MLWYGQQQQRLDNTSNDIWRLAKRPELRDSVLHTMLVNLCELLAIL
eukprot:COSAG02_NODE_56883_length_283_cov_0.836957_2_plen_46_part_01